MSKSRPIIFSAQMVRALLDGTKTQTRRIVKPRHLKFFDQSASEMIDNWGKRPLPYGKKLGDTLWVREKHAFTDLFDGTPVVAYSADSRQIAIGRETPDGDDFLLHNYTFNRRVDIDHWKPSIHMPRWASRITLGIINIRVERLKDISEADALAEGIDRLTYGGQTTYRNYAITDDLAQVSPMLESPIDSYRTLFESINGAGSWDENPWVWVIEFKVLK